MILPMVTVTGLEAILRTAHGSGLTLQVLTIMLTTAWTSINALFKSVVTMDMVGQVLIAVVQIMNITLFVSK